VTAVADARLPGGTNDSWPSLLRAYADRLLVFAVSKDRNAKAVVLLFDEGRADPVMVAKVPTTVVAQQQVCAEFGALVRIRDRLTGDLRRTVPEPVQLLSHDGCPILLMSAVPGASGLARYHGWRHTSRRAGVRADLDAAATWLTAFQTATATRVQPVDLLGAVADRLAERFGNDDSIDDVIARIPLLRHRMGRCRSPRTAEHGDYWFGNLLFGGGQVSGVIDWEMALPTDGEPARDLARFFVSYSLYLDRHASRRGHVRGHDFRAVRWGDGVRYAVNGDGWYPSLARAFLRTGLHRLGMPAERGREVVLAELLTVAAQADDEEFARQHLRLFRDLSDDGRR